MKKYMESIKENLIRRLLMTIFIMALTTFTAAHAQSISGMVIDEKSGEPLVGVVIEVEGNDTKAVSDIDGKFEIKDLSSDTYTLLFKYVGYKTETVSGIQAREASQESDIKVVMKLDEQQLEGVVVTGVERKNTEVSAIQRLKNSPIIVSNVSAQEISKTQDNNASEVIRRVPGVSLIDDKFVMVRGLSQRYNNVWINGSAVPSSEADSRAFSFDIIPSNQIDNLTIVKAPASEYPADYSGGFIMIDTKEIPATNAYAISVGGNWNDATVFQSFLKNQRDDSWYTKDMKPLGDLKLSASMNHKWKLWDSMLGMLATVYYTNEYRTYSDMANNLFGVYDTSNDRSNYLRRSTDNQYNNNDRLGAMLNLTWLSGNGNHKLQLKNIFNRLTNTRYTWREGISAQSDPEKSAEYYYRDRITYNGQLTGKHTFKRDALDWSTGYSFANRRMPDRRRYLITDDQHDGTYRLSTGNDVSREWTKLNENIVSVSVNDTHDFQFGSWSPTLKVGAYGEYRDREYTTQEFILGWDTYSNDLPSGFQTMDIPTLLSDEDNYGDDKLYELELSQWTNNYRGKNTLGAGYLTASLPFGHFNIYAGVRFEYNDMELITNTRDNEKSEKSSHYKTNDFFPAASATYKINEQHQIRLSYGKTVNRPEFREKSSSVYYDFDLASSVQGNYDLRNCYIQNVDLRYEFYPSKGEVISVAAFYKYFDSPIEWVYTVSGGTDLIYSYMNAKSANNYGVEVEIRKDLSFIGLSGFSWSFNGALIKSKVQFEEGSLEEDRPMQGQSPYLINTGLFYRDDHHQWNVALLYNRIGKRIVGVGRSEGSDADINNKVPDSYEMPHNSLDLSVSKKWGKHWEAKLSARNILDEKIDFKQFADVTYSDGTTKKVTQVTREYHPGRDIGMQLVYNF